MVFSCHIIPLPDLAWLTKMQQSPTRYPPCILKQGHLSQTERTWLHHATEFLFFLKTSGGRAKLQPCGDTLSKSCVLYSECLGVFPKHPMAQEGCYAQIIIACVHLVGEVPAL